MQALFFRTLALLCLLGTSVLFADNLTWIDSLAISNEAAQQYVDDYKDIAVSDMHRTGIPASIKLAQAMFESNFGRSDLAIRGNNHFGIKCYRSWKGGKLYYHDDKPNECFRQYDWVDDSYKDHSRIITSKKRYAGLFELAPIDYKGWAKGLQKMGYATDPQYAKKLIWMIEKHDLHQYDFEEDPFMDMDETPLIGSSNDELDGPIIYAYKFGDVEKAAPDKLKIHKTNAKKLIDPAISSVPKTLVNSNELTQKTESIVIATQDKEAKIPVPTTTEDISVLTEKRTAIHISRLPQQYLTKVENGITDEITALNPSFNKRTIPKFMPVFERENIEIPSMLATAKSNTLIEESSWNIESSNLANSKRPLPKIDYVFEEDLEEVSLTATLPKPKTKIVEAVIASPSATTESDAFVLLSKQEIAYVNKLKVVQYDETVGLESIAHTYQLSLEELIAYNDVPEGMQTFHSDMPIYLEAKKSKPSGNSAKEHIVEQDETMWEIAQQYGLQLEGLLKRNYMKTGEEPRNGEKILLKAQAPYPPKIKREKPKANVSKDFMQATLEKLKEKRN